MELASSVLISRSSVSSWRHLLFASLMDSFRSEEAPSNSIESWEGWDAGPLERDAPNRKPEEERVDACGDPTYGDGRGDFRSERSVTDDSVLGEAAGLRVKKEVNLLPGV